MPRRLTGEIVSEVRNYQLAKTRTRRVNLSVSGCSGVKQKECTLYGAMATKLPGRFGRRPVNLRTRKTAGVRVGFAFSSDRLLRVTLKRNSDLPPGSTRCSYGVFTLAFGETSGPQASSFPLMHLQASTGTRSRAK